MTDFPPLPPSLRALSVSITLVDRSDRHQEGVFRLHTDSQGAGCYPVLDFADAQDPSDPGKPHRVAFDPGPLKELAQWSADLCRWIDGQQVEQQQEAQP